MPTEKSNEKDLDTSYEFSKARFAGIETAGKQLQNPNALLWTLFIPRDPSSHLARPSANELLHGSVYSWYQKWCIGAS